MDLYCDENIKKLWKYDKVGTIFTPVKVVMNMLDLLDEIGFWDKPDTLEGYSDSHRLLDINCKSGKFLQYAYVKFSLALGQIIFDKEERDRYIWGNLLYGFCRNEFVCYALRQKFNSEHIFYVKDILGVELDMKFDVVVGNPPYQHANGGGSVYQDFGCKMYEMSKRFMLLICPDRWNLSNQSKSFGLFRSYVLDTNNLSSLVHIASEQGRTYVFGDAGTRELTYFLVDKNKNSNRCRLIEQSSLGDVLGDNVVIVKNPFYYSVIFASIIEKVHKKCDKFLYDNTELVTYDELDSSQFNSASECMTDCYNLKAYGSRGTVAYVSLSYFTHSYISINKWKVLLARSGTGAIIAEPNSVATRQLYMLYFNTQLEAINCRDYTQTKFFRCVRVNSTAGMSSSVDSFKNLPYLDFTRSWTDEDINSYFRFTDAEIEYINSFTH